MGRSGSRSRKDADHFGVNRVAWRKDGVIVAAPADHASYAGSHCCSGPNGRNARDGEQSQLLLLAHRIVAFVAFLAFNLQESRTLTRQYMISPQYSTTVSR